MNQAETKGLAGRVSHVMGHLGTLLSKSAGVLCMRVVALLLMYVTTQKLAVTLGTKNFGIFSVGYTLISVLSIFVIFGLDRLVLREVAACAVRHEWPLIRGLMVWSTRVVVRAAVIVVIVGALVVAFLHHVGRCDTPSALTYVVALTALPFWSISVLRQAILRGLHHALLGFLPEYIVVPGILYAGVMLLSGRSAGALQPALVMGIYCGACILACCVGVLVLRRVWRTTAGEVAHVVYMAHMWFKKSLPLAILTAVYIINAKIDLLMVYFLRGESAAGIYSVAGRFADLATFILVANDAVLAPLMADLYSRGHLASLQGVCVRSARWVALMVAGIVLVLAAGSHWFVRRYFGAPYLPGVPSLILLSSAQLITACMGSLRPLLIMTGFTHEAVYGNLLGSFVMVICAALFIPAWGITGAALATLLGTIAWNVQLFVYARRKISVNPSILGVAVVTATRADVPGKHPMAASAQHEPVSLH